MTDWSFTPCNFLLSYFLHYIIANFRFREKLQNLWNIIWIVSRQLNVRQNFRNTIRLSVSVEYWNCFCVVENFSRCNQEHYSFSCSLRNSKRFFRSKPSFANLIIFFLIQTRIVTISTFELIASFSKYIKIPVNLVRVSSKCGIQWYGWALSLLSYAHTMKRMH